MRSISKPKTPRDFIDTIGSLSVTGRRIKAKAHIKVPHRIVEELRESVNRQVRDLDQMFVEFATDGTFERPWLDYPMPEPPWDDDFFFPSPDDFV
jgi:hypothetical protein